MNIVFTRTVKKESREQNTVNIVNSIIKLSNYITIKPSNYQTIKLSLFTHPVKIALKLLCDSFRSSVWLKSYLFISYSSAA